MNTRTADTIRLEISARRGAAELIDAELAGMTEGTECYDAEEAHFFLLVDEIQALEDELAAL